MWTNQYLAFLVLVMVSVSCGDSVAPPVMSPDSGVDLTDFVTEAVTDGSTLVYKLDEGGDYLIYGYVKDGVKDGIWVEFHPNNIVKSIHNYTAGIENGPRLEFSTRGQVEKMTQVKDNALHGKYAEFKFGRYVNQSDYANGVLDGQYKEYFKNTDKIQKMVEFKAGKQDGKMQYFDEEGNVTLEYTYRNGEKVSGGLND